jgi:phosphoglycerate-specific signal transduction histidine kinase
MNNDEGRNERAFRNFGKRIDSFLEELDEAGERLRKEFEAKFEELKEAGERLKKEANDSERWKEVESSLKKAGDELTQAFKAAFRKRRA